MSLNEYITEADLTPTVASGFVKTEYISRTNEHCDYINYSLGVTPASGTIHFVLKEYARAWCLREIYKDKIGANNPNSIDQDKYLLLYNIQNDEVEKIKKSLTPEIVSNMATTAGSTCYTTRIFRG